MTKSAPSAGGMAEDTGKTGSTAMNRWMLGYMEGSFVFSFLTVNMCDVTISEKPILPDMSLKKQ